MPLLPIDLQTMFGQMSHVGKEQAVQNENAPHYQSAQAAEIVKRTEEADSAVNQSRELGEGPEKLKGQSRRKGKRGSGEQEPERKENQADTGKEVLSDPDLGHNVDVVG
jgi:hypothetical protein